MDDLVRARLNRIVSNTAMRPIELLKLMIDDIERGKLKCDGLVVLTANRPDGRPWTYETYRCGMPREQELVTIVMAQERTIRNWRLEDGT